MSFSPMPVQVIAPVLGTAPQCGGSGCAPPAPNPPGGGQCGCGCDCCSGTAGGGVTNPYGGAGADVTFYPLRALGGGGCGCGAGGGTFTKPYPGGNGGDGGLDDVTFYPLR